MEKKRYIPPQVEVIEVVIEKGFAGTTPMTPIDDWNPKNF